MSVLGVDHARRIVASAVAHARDEGLRPLSVIVLDQGGHIILFEREDGATMAGFRIAQAKAYGALSLGMGSRSLATLAVSQPAMMASVTAALGGRLIAAPGGVLVRDRNGGLLGAVGVSGDSSDNDERAAVSGVTAAGFEAVPG